MGGRRGRRARWCREKQHARGKRGEGADAEHDMGMRAKRWNNHREKMRKSGDGEAEEVARK